MPGTDPEPSLAPRAAEAIDPRLPVPSVVPAGPVDPALVQRLEALVGTVRAGVPLFDARQAEAARLAGQAGPMASESWIEAEKALSLLIEQYGVTTRAAADIDAMASGKLASQRWIAPADQAAITAAAAEVAVISARQADTLGQLKDQLAR